MFLNAVVEVMNMWKYPDRECSKWQRFQKYEMKPN